MKKFVAFCLICVIFCLCNSNTMLVSATHIEQIDFVYNNKIFSYQLEQNIKSSSVFDIDYKINKYHRFSSNYERKKLLKHMIDIGIDKEVALEYIFPNLSKTICEIEKNIYIKPQDAKLNINTTTEKVFHISNEIVGKFVDKNKLINSIYSKFLNDDSSQINIPTINLLPEITKNDYEKFSHLRADFSTSIASSTEDRKHNIKNALNTLNKVEIAPNEIFSFNKTIGRRTKENGYREAKIIVNNDRAEIAIRR